MGVITNKAETSFFDQGEKKLKKKIEKKIEKNKTYRTSNDIIAGNGSERFMIAIKFSENIFHRTA